MRQLLALGAILLFVAACGGDDAAGVVGGDLEVPDWFPSPFTLPEDLRIVETVEDPANQRASLYGVVDGGDAAAILQEIAIGLPGDGFERLTDGTQPLVFLKDGVGRVRVRVGELQTSDGTDVEVRVDIDTWTDEQIAEFRTSTAEDVKTTGSVVATIDGMTYEVSGECVIGGREYAFATNDGPSLSVSINEWLDPPRIYASLYDSGDADVSYVPVDEASLEGQVTSPASPVAFSVSGQVMEENSGEGPLDATWEVTCEPVPDEPDEERDGTPTTEAPLDLAGTRWFPANFNYQPGDTGITNPVGDGVFFEFGDDGTFLGSTGCNEFEGTWEITGPYDDGQPLVITAERTTAVECEGFHADDDVNLLGALVAVEIWEIGNRLGDQDRGIMLSGDGATIYADPA